MGSTLSYGEHERRSGLPLLVAFALKSPRAVGEERASRLPRIPCHSGLLGLATAYISFAI